MLQSRSIAPLILYLRASCPGRFHPPGNSRQYVLVGRLGGSNSRSGNFFGRREKRLRNLQRR